MIAPKGLVAKHVPSQGIRPIPTERRQGSVQYPLHGKTDIGQTARCWERRSILIQVFQFIPDEGLLADAVSGKLASETHCPFRIMIRAIVYHSATPERPIPAVTWSWISSGPARKRNPNLPLAIDSTQE